MLATEICSASPPRSPEYVADSCGTLDSEDLEVPLALHATTRLNNNSCTVADLPRVTHMLHVHCTHCSSVRTQRVRVYTRNRSVKGCQICGRGRKWPWGPHLATPVEQERLYATVFLHYVATFSYSYIDYTEGCTVD